MAAIYPGVMGWCIGSVFSYCTSRHFIPSVDPKIASTTIMCTHIFSLVVSGGFWIYLGEPIFKETPSDERAKKLLLAAQQTGVLSNLTAALTILALRSLGQRFHLRTPPVLEALGLYYSTRTIITVCDKTIQWMMPRSNSV